MKYISCIFFFFYCLLPHSYCQLDSLGLDTTIIYSSLEEALKNPKNVYRLNLKRKKLTEFPKEILELTNLWELNLSRNKIYELPKEIELTIEATGEKATLSDNALRHSTSMAW